MTPLQLAVSLSQLDFVDMLIFYHAKVDQADDVILFLLILFYLLVFLWCLHYI